MNKNNFETPHKDRETKEEETDKGKKPDDGLSFFCETCQDVGCPSCGWGRKKREAEEEQKSES